MYLAKLFKSSGFYLAIIMTLACSILGTILGGLPYLSIIGALVISLVLGMMFQLYRPAINKAEMGIGFISNKFLRLGIILLGFKLNLIDLAHAGVKTILLAMIIVSGVDPAMECSSAIKIQSNMRHCSQGVPGTAFGRHPG